MSCLNSFSSTGNSKSKNQSNGLPGSTGSMIVGAGVGHLVDRPLDDRDYVREGAELGIELAAIDPDPRSLERVVIEEAGVVVRQLVFRHLAEWGLKRVQRHGDVRHGPADRSRGVLAVPDRDDPRLRDQPDRRLQPDHELLPDGAHDRAVRLGTDRAAQRFAAAATADPELEPHGSNSACRDRA